VSAPEERGVAFACEGEQLVGVLSLPAEGAAEVGVVIAVGGPQYRAGSHRQFVLMARRLARAGHATLRFDVRGMGDASGEFPGFEALGPDLAAALRTLQAEVPAVRRVVLWGLCDAASAALMNATTMPALAGLVLLNPWVRHADTQARTEVKQYYAQRAFDPVFWRKLLAGRVDLWAAARELSSKLLRMARSYAAPAPVQPGDFRERMALGALGFGGPQLYILSGQDHVCAEFLEFSGGHPRLKGLWSQPGVQRLDLPQADHTFSNHALRTQVEDATLAWLAGLRSAA
jgi:uncharacterized protein